MPKYLLKFLKRERLEYLLTKGLYMNAVGYFSAMGYESDDNQNDRYEGLASLPYREMPKREKSVQERLTEARTEFDKFCAQAPIIAYNVYKGRSRPIWCCSRIEENDICDGILKIDKRVLYDFFKGDTQNGVAVLIDYDNFIELIKSNPDEYETIYGNVDYNNIHKVRGSFVNSGVWWDSIFNKRDDLSYQREFRVAICRNCEENLEDVIIDHIKMQTLKKGDPYKAYEYILPNIQSAVVRTYNITDLEQDDTHIYFNVNC